MANFEYQPESTASYFIVLYYGVSNTFSSTCNTPISEDELTPDFVTLFQDKQTYKETKCSYRIKTIRISLQIIYFLLTLM